MWDGVDLPGEGPEVEDAEDGHFDAEEEGGDADFYVRGLELSGGFDGAGGGEEGDEELDWGECVSKDGVWDGGSGVAYCLPE